jgi:hypothetical protein
LAIISGFLAWKTNGDLQGSLVAATAALAGGSLAAFNGFLQQLADRSERRHTARRGAYQELLRVLTTYNGHRTTARLWWNQLQGAKDDQVRKDFSAWGLAAYEQARELWTQIGYAFSNARIGAGPGTLGAIDAVEAEFQRTRGFEMENPDAELDLKQLQEEMAKEIEFAPTASLAP